MKRPVLRLPCRGPATTWPEADRPARAPIGALLAVVVAVAVALTACGGDGGGGDAVGGPPTTETRPSAALDGLTFGSREVVGRRLEPDTGVTLSFDDGRITARAGCNTMSGPYRIDGTVLRVGPDLASTAMGCEPPLMEQDRWVGEFLVSGPTMSRSGEELSLRSGPVMLRLVAPEERPPAPLIGTAWVLDSIIHGDTASNVPTGADHPTLRIDRSGEAAVSTSCNRGGAHVEVEGNRVTFGPLRLTKMACKGAAGEVEAAVTAVLEGEVEVRAEADRLFVTRGDQGLIYRASE